MEGHNVCLSQGRSEAEDMGIKTNNPEIAFNRGTVYELMSHCFGEPETGFLEFIKKGEFFEHMINALRFHPELKNGILKTLQSLTDEAIRVDIEELSEGYRLLVSPERNLLYEGNYHHPFNTYEEMADIAGFYRAFGFRFEGERPDHICLELEFMRILALKEAIALKDGDEEKGSLTIKAEKEFLLSHIGRWTEALLKMTEDLRFYGTLSRFLKEWIDMECDLYSVRPERVFYINRMDEENNNEFCLKEGSDERIQ